MIKITNEDNMLLMARYEDNYFDLAIVDPPYFSDYAKEMYPGAKISTIGVKRNVFKSNHWEVPNEKYFNELFRVSKHQIIWGCNYYAKYIPHVGRIIWDKKNDLSTFSKGEIASQSFKIGVHMFRYLWNGMFQENMKNKEIKIHPTQKPIALYEWLLMNYAKENDKIVDTHLGSGSIAIACHNLGFDLTACELDKDYYKSALKRLKEHQQQLTFF